MPICLNLEIHLTGQYLRKDWFKIKKLLKTKHCQTTTCLTTKTSRGVTKQKIHDMHVLQNLGMIRFNTIHDMLSSVIFFKNLNFDILK